MTRRTQSLISSMSHEDTFERRIFSAYGIFLFSYLQAQNVVIKSVTILLSQKEMSDTQALPQYRCKYSTFIERLWSRNEKEVIDLTS